MECKRLIITFTLLLSGASTQIRAAYTDADKTEQRVRRFLVDLDTTINHIQQYTGSGHKTRREAYKLGGKAFEGKLMFANMDSETKQQQVTCECNTMYRHTLNAIDLNVDPNAFYEKDSYHQETLMSHFFTPSYKACLDKTFLSVRNPAIGAIVALIGDRLAELKTVPPLITAIAQVGGNMYMWLGVITFVWQLNKTRQLIAQRKKELREQKKPESFFELDRPTAILQAYTETLQKVSNQMKEDREQESWSEKTAERKIKYLSSACEHVYQLTAQTYQEAFPMAIYDGTKLQDHLTPAPKKNATASTTTLLQPYTPAIKSALLSRWNPIIGGLTTIAAREIKKRKLAPSIVATALQLCGFGHCAISTGMHIQRLINTKK